MKEMGVLLVAAVAVTMRAGMNWADWHDAVVWKTGTASKLVNAICLQLVHFLALVMKQ